MFKPVYNGIKYDSVNELKYALSIEDEFCFIHHPFTIFDAYYYDETKFIDQYAKSYTPDFLIRDINTRTATLIEVKGFSNEDKEKRTRLAEKFIYDHQRDYNFEWIKVELCEMSPSKEEKLGNILNSQKEHRRLNEKLADWHKRNIPYYNPFQMSSKEFEQFTRYGSQEPVVECNDGIYLVSI